MKLFDAHCDVLLKMWRDRELSFKDGKGLHINLDRLESAGSKVQCFAIFIPESVSVLAKFEAALQMVDVFYERILNRYENVKLVTSKQEISELKQGEIGAVLTLEGCDAVDVDLSKLRTLFRLGVTSVGLTWNNANACADGAEESRGGGLTDFGRQVVEENNRHRVWTDVSHLPVAAFWDVMETADFPIASHSNARALRDHQRNLYDDQIRALLKKNGMMGMVFKSGFLKDEGIANIDDILRHIEHVCELGGEKQIGFGSDFDGIEDPPDGLSHFGEYPNLVDALLKRYSEDTVIGFCYRNFVEHYPR
ncbi:MAG TPA: dipeptidase [Bacillales bacterium]|nr:dipeptidase [Bacillales bacterium]